MAVSLSPFAGAGWQFFDNNGVILSGGKLYVYAAGTTSAATTYTSSTGSTANTNPIILNSSGRLANEIWLTTGLNYKFILKTSADVLIGTWDNIPAGTTDVADLQAALASSTGAGMIGYIQGGTAVATTVQAKLRETVSVKDFGADPSATAAVNNAAFVAALAASDNVYIPSGTYNVTGSINIQNKSIHGADARTTIIQLTGTNTNTPVFINSATSLSTWGTGGGFTMSGITVSGNWDGTSANPVSVNNFDSLGSLIKWYAGAYVNISNCKFENSYAHALAFQRLGYSYIQNNEITTNAYNGVSLEGVSSAESITSTWVSNNSIHSCTGTACIYVKEALTSQFLQNVLEDAANGIYVDGNDNRTVSVCFNDMEQMSNSGVYIAGAGTEFNISNNYLGVTTPLTVTTPTGFFGVVQNNSFATSQYITSLPTIGNGTASNVNQDFFGQAVNNTVPGYLRWRTNNNYSATTPIAYIGGIHDGTVNQLGGILAFATANKSTNTLSNVLYISGTGVVYPANDNSQTLGSATNRWSVVYAGTGTINTSDERAKQDIADLDAAEKRVAVALKGLVKKFRFKNAVEAKGNSARIHVGVIAQEVVAAFETEGLDATRYGLLCYDEWGSTDDTPAGNRYGVRYEELLAFIIAAL